MRSFKQFNRNLKAISPIFATLILIAIAVIAGVVVYMFTSGTLSTMTSGGTAGQEKIAIQSVTGTEVTGTTDDTITIYAQSLSGGTVTISSVIVKDAGGNPIGAPITLSASNTITSALSTISVTVPDASVAAGNHYSVTLISVAGGNFPSQSFKVA